MIDPADLRLMQLSEIRLGITFYRKDPDGFHACKITQEDVDGRGARLRELSNQYVQEGRLYIRTSNPGQSFV